MHVFRAVVGFCFWWLVRLFSQGGDFWDGSGGVTAVCNCNDWEGNSGAEGIIFCLLNTGAHMYMDDGDKFQIL